MSARSRNAYLAAVVTFGNWCVENDRLASNPFSRISKANEKADPRRKRRALTADEIRRLLSVTRWRPLADHGRTSTAVEAGSTRKRSNWRKAELTFEGLMEAVQRARIALEDNPKLIAKLDSVGLERALMVKVLVLTGLRRGELASLTVGQLVLDDQNPHVVLHAADEKNGQGALIPIRPDLSLDLKYWMQERNLEGRYSDKLFSVPKSFVRVLDRDLKAAGIPKRDDRGRTIDVHALRHTFGTLLSTSGVAPRTAQAAMRHSSIELTMNTYTDPKLLDVSSAVAALPDLELPVAPDVAPTSGDSGHAVTLPGISSVKMDLSQPTWMNAKSKAIIEKKPWFSGFENQGFQVGTVTTGLNKWRHWLAPASASIPPIARRNCGSWHAL